MTQLRESILFLRDALDDLEMELGSKDLSAAGLEDFKSKLDGVRTTVLAVLAADDPSDYQQYVRRLRLRRATQVCQGVLFGLLDGTVSAETDGMAGLRSTLAEMLPKLRAQGDLT
jgi:hypothetical protein